MPYDIQRRAQFANGLKAARKRSGLSAQQAAALLTAQGLECSRGTLLAWERGLGTTTREPFASDLVMIAKIYRCPVDMFFATVETPQSSANFNSDPEADGDGRPQRAYPDGHSHSG